jgi:hypothetical protein
MNYPPGAPAPYLFTPPNSPGGQAFFPGNQEISVPPPCVLLIGIYLFYENWSTESFGRKESTLRLPGLSLDFAQAEGLRVDPERRIVIPPLKVGLGAVERVKKVGCMLHLFICKVS